MGTKWENKTQTIDGLLVLVCVMLGTTGVMEQMDSVILLSPPLWTGNPYPLVMSLFQTFSS